MSKTGSGLLFLFCYVDFVAALAIGDWISSVEGLLLYGAPAAFVAGVFISAVHDAYLRREQRKAVR